MSTIKVRDDAPTVVVVGGGAAGLTCAVFAAACDVRVILFEKNEKLGRKLRITGKGRCNVTNNCTVPELMNNIPTNPRFLYSAFNRFSPADTMAFFESIGVPLKTERGRRVFPVSDKAADVVAALADECHRKGVEVRHENVKSLVIEDGAVRGVVTDAGETSADAVVVCTGGLSYPLTGSTGDGYRFAQQAGHSVTPASPSLVPLTAAGHICDAMQGLSLKNVALQIRRQSDDALVYEDFGEMMFTHFGMTGPMILSGSAHLQKNEKYRALIDFKPALDLETLDKRILSDFTAYSTRDLINALDDLLPQKARAVIVSLSGVDPHKKVNAVTQKERAALLSVIKGMPITITGMRPIDEAIITRGGVNIKEINPRTMQSKLCDGLFFAGEVMDVDAYTGGYNLQIAFATAVCAAEGAAVSAQERKNAGL